MLGRLFALFGFARTESQQATPPFAAYLLVVAAAYYAAVIVELAAHWLGPTFSVYMRTLGLVATIFFVHSVYRAIVHNDDVSYGGWLRKAIKR